MAIDWEAIKKRFSKSKVESPHGGAEPSLGSGLAEQAKEKMADYNARQKEAIDAADVSAEDSAAAEDLLKKKKAGQ